MAHDPLVNRFWMRHFGRGIVNTPGDFGVLGDRPTHPELLDWLASEFVETGWDVKRFHRLVMTSAAYRQQGAEGTEFGDDSLYPRFPLWRLDAETFRDSALAVAGKLNPRRGGPPVPVMADLVGQFVIGRENLDAGRPGKVIPMNGEEFRKSVYVQRRRSRPLTVLDTFDLPRMEPNCVKRNNSTVATQSLFLMNSPFAIAVSEAFAARVTREAGDTPSDRVRRAWQLAYAREPADDELTGALAYLDAQAKQFGDKPKNATLASLCQLLLSSNEFLYID